MSFPDAREFWNQRFDRDDYLFGTAPNRFLVSQRHLLRPGLRVLSLADGEGRNSVWMAEQGAEVTGIEISPIAVEKARRLAAQRGVSPRLHVGSVFESEWPGEPYDIVAAIFIQFAGPEERARLFSRMVDAIRPGGRLILQGYTPRQIEYRTGGPPHAENMYTETMLRQSFSALRIEHLREHEDMLDEGSGHSGRSALIELVAIKPIA